MQTPKKLLVIGSAGFLGRSLVSGLAESTEFSGIEVRGLDLDSSEPGIAPVGFEEVVGSAHNRELLRLAILGVDLVWIRAGKLGGAKSVNIEDMHDYYRQNVELTSTILGVCDELGCRRIIYDSTQQVFGRRADRWPTSIDAEPIPRNFYGASKLASEKLLRHWAVDRGDGRSATIFRYSRIRADDTRDVIYHMVTRALKGESIRVIGDAERQIEFVHLDDVVRANLEMLSVCVPHLILHVSADEPISLSELAERVRDRVSEITGSLVDIQFEPAPHRIEWEPQVVGLEWRDTVAKFDLPQPVDVDTMIDRSIDYWRA